MDNLNLILAICIMTPLAMMLVISKGRTRIVIGFLMSGIFMCLFAGEINGLIYKSSSAEQNVMTINIAPIVEEILKAIPVLFLTFLLKPKRRMLIECSIAVGVGFAILENAYILTGMVDRVSVIWALIRGFGAGMMHGISTLFVGYSMSYVYTKRNLFWTGSIAALSVAIVYHSIYNIFVQSEYSLCGILLPIATYIPLTRIILKQGKSE